VPSSELGRALSKWGGGADVETLVGRLRLRSSAEFELHKIGENSMLAPVSPNKTLQRSWTHKLLGCRRADAVRDVTPRAGMLNCRRAAAELCRYTTGSTELI
jgi:hypothetical protein